MSWKTLEVDVALENLQASLKVVQEVDDKSGLNEITRSLGWVYWLKGEYVRAISYYEESLAGLEELQFDTEEIKANIQINLGNIYFEKSDWTKSIEYFTGSLNIFKEIENDYKIARIFNNIGCVYAENGELGRAYNFFKKGIKLSDEVYYVRGKAYTLLHQGELFIQRKQFKDSEKVLSDALDIFSRIEDHLGIVYTKINIGLINFFYQNWYKAKDYFQGCVDILIDLDVGFLLGEVYLGLSIIYSNLNNLELTKEFKKNADITFRNITKIEKR
jgi:tetratricopeptide (TPR) repeat protein